MVVQKINFQGLLAIFLLACLRYAAHRFSFGFYYLLKQGELLTIIVAELKINIQFIDMRNYEDQDLMKASSLKL